MNNTAKNTQAWVLILCVPEWEKQDADKQRDPDLFKKKKKGQIKKSFVQPESA